MQAAYSRGILNSVYLSSYKLSTYGDEMTILAALFYPLLLALTLDCPLEKEIPALPKPEGAVQWVKNTAELRQVLENAPHDVTILVADGTYDLAEPIYMKKGKNVVIRGASGNPAKATIRGGGFYAGRPDKDLLQIGNVDNVTIAYLTFAECRSYGVKIEAENFPRNVHIFGCHFRDIGVRMIKGSTSLEGKASGGSIRYCRFENTQVPPVDWLYEGDYITAIDMMALEDWQISDNLFINIKGHNGGARGAIFIWVRSKNVTVERNAIINCDRGISLGNPSGSTNYLPGQEHIRDSVVRNNIIIPGPDAGIELWWAENIKVYNNTIWREDAAGPGLRGGMDNWKINRIDVANNLVRGANMLTGGVTPRNNLFGTLDGIKIDFRPGSRRLSGFVPSARSRGVPLEEVKDDFAGHARPQKPDIGACEFGKAE